MARMTCHWILLPTLKTTMLCLCQAAGIIRLRLLFWRYVEIVKSVCVCECVCGTRAAVPKFAVSVWRLVAQHDPVAVYYYLCNKTVQRSGVATMCPLESFMKQTKLSKMLTIKSRIDQSRSPNCSHCGKCWQLLLGFLPDYFCWRHLSGCH